MYAGSKYESHYTVWTAWISIRVRVRVTVYSILQNLAPPGTTVHVPTAPRTGEHTCYPYLKVEVCTESSESATDGNRKSVYRRKETHEKSKLSMLEIVMKCDAYLNRDAIARYQAYF